MSDERLRQLERRWRETGAVDDGATYLLERVRVGDLPRERLELAAYCGHEAAMRCIGSAPPEQDLTRWLVGLDRWGRSTLVRGLVRVALAAYASAEAELPIVAAGRRALATVEAWCACPCADCAAAVEVAAEEAMQEFVAARRGALPQEEVMVPSQGYAAPRVNLTRGHHAMLTAVYASDAEARLRRGDTKVVADVAVSGTSAGVSSALIRSDILRTVGDLTAD